LTSHIFGLSGISVERIHISVLSILFNGASLFFVLQFVCGFEKMVGEEGAGVERDSHILVSFGSVDPTGKGAVQVLEHETSFGVLGVR
jgi:hypothetical protein